MRILIQLSASSLTLLVHAATALSQNTCLEGVLGNGARMRRVVVDSLGADGTRLHVFTRPVRQHTLVRRADGVWAAGDTTLLATAGSREPEILEIRNASDTVRAALTPVAPAPVAHETLGNWTAFVDPAGVVRLVANISSLPCGAIVGAFDSPDQGQRDLPFTAARVTRDSLFIAASYLDLEIVLPLSGSDMRRARMTQRGTNTVVEFRRGDASTLRRPQEPQRPFPYTEREVRFPGQASAAPLVGTLTLPSGDGPHAAIVLISGSGAQDRDETVAGHKPFLVLADHLTRAGYAVLRFDDRPNAIGMTLEERAVDAAGAVTFLKSQAEIDGRRIGLLGHSEGGVVAPIVARANRDVAFLVMLGAPAVTGYEVLEAQSTAMLRATGLPEPEVRVDSLIRTTVFDVLRANPSSGDIAIRVDGAVARLVRGLETADRRRVDAWLAVRTPAQDSAAIALWTSRWFKSLFHHDPAPLLREIEVPLLAIYGALDLQVPPNASLAALEHHFAGARRRLLRAELLPGVNHMMQPARSGTMDEYRTIEQTIADRVFAVLDDWLQRHVPSSRPR
jgi:dienelactone hydrolase